MTGAQLETLDEGALEERTVLYQSLHGCRRNIKSGLCGL